MTISECAGENFISHLQTFCNAAAPASERGPHPGMLAVGCMSGWVSMFDQDTGKVRHNFVAHESSHVRCVAVSPNGRSMASGGRDCSWKVWSLHEDDMRGPAPRPRVVVSGHDGEGECTCGRDEEQKEECPVVGHSALVLAIAFSGCGKRVATGGWDKQIMVWDSSDGREYRRLAGHSDAVYAVAFAPRKSSETEGALLASGGRDGRLFLWDVVRGEALRLIREAHSGGVLSLAFEQSGRLLASVGADSLVRLWEVATGSETRRLSGHGNAVRAVAFSPDGRTLASCGWDRSVCIWDTRLGRETMRLRGHDGTEGCRCARGTTDTSCEVQGHRGEVWSVAFSIDGLLIASGGADMACKVWEVATGALRYTLELGSPVNAVVFGRDWAADRQLCLAFAMGQHHRLGAESCVHCVDAGVTRMILQDFE